MATIDWKKLSWWIGALTLLAALTAPEVAAAQRSVSAPIQEPFAVNGEVFTAGNVTLREVSDYNPATTLNEIWVGDRCLGLMLASVSADSANGDDDRVIFERNASGTLVLVGFAYRDQPEREFYGYDDDATGRRWSAPAQRSVQRVATMFD